MIRIIAFAAVILALVYVLAPGLQTASQLTGGDIGPAQDETSAASIEPGVRSTSSASASIARGPEGHFTTQAKVNGATVRMIVDSGATLVVLRREDALAAGISVFPSEFTGSAQTAGGTVRTKRVVLSRISVGGIERRNVAAAVVDADLPVSLLGQSFLAQLGEVSIADDAMTLR